MQLTAARGPPDRDLPRPAATSKGLDELASRIQQYGAEQTISMRILEES